MFAGPIQYYRCISIDVIVTVQILSLHHSNYHLIYGLDLGCKTWYRCVYLYSILSTSEIARYCPGIRNFHYSAPPPSLSISLSQSLSFSLYFYLSLSLSLSLYIYIYIYIYLTPFLPLSLPPGEERGSSVGRARDSW